MDCEQTESEAVLVSTESEKSSSVTVTFFFTAQATIGFGLLDIHSEKEGGG